MGSNRKATVKICDIHPEYEGLGKPRVDCECCWAIRRKAVGCIEADIERDELREKLGLGKRSNNTLIKMPFAGSQHVM